MSDARKNRGTGNGGDAYRSSTFWDNIKKSNKNKGEDKMNKVEMVQVTRSVFELADYENMNLMYSRDGVNFSKFSGDERTLMRCLIEITLYEEKAAER
jgi:hypothetical protein